MGKLGLRITALAGLVSLGACYHQVVQTGLPAGTQRIEKPWTATWFFGLVPATPIDVRSQCTSGVAIVDTQTSFVNGLVSGLTLLIYTPRSVIVTCAARSSANGAQRLDVASNDPDALGAALSRAESLSRESRRSVYVVFPESLGAEAGSTMGGTR